MEFLIQTGNNPEQPIEHDFSFTLLKAIEYRKWRVTHTLEDDIKYEFITHWDFENKFYGRFAEGMPYQYKNYCPIGSVEFVLNFYKLVWRIENIKPINVPECLFGFAGRTIYNIDNKDITKYDGLNYIKSNDIIKFEENGVYEENDLSKLPNGNYQISKIIDDIDVEYRVFVLNNEVLGIQHYGGDFRRFPDDKELDDIDTMVLTYKNNGNPPPAYTLDVFGDNRGFHVMEVHDFFSCGLYGFADLDKLPIMFWRSHLDKIKNI
jgi:hypothetical protein